MIIIITETKQGETSTQHIEMDIIYLNSKNPSLIDRCSDDTYFKEKDQLGNDDENTTGYKDIGRNRIIKQQQAYKFANRK